MDHLPEAARRPTRRADHAFALGMDNREIARALGRSDGATVLIHRAIKQLDEEMNSDGE